MPETKEKTPHSDVADKFEDPVGESTRFGGRNDRSAAAGGRVEYGEAQSRQDSQGIAGKGDWCVTHGKCDGDGYRSAGHPKVALTDAVHAPPDQRHEEGQVVDESHDEAGFGFCTSIDVLSQKESIFVVCKILKSGMDFDSADPKKDDNDDEPQKSGYGSNAPPSSLPLARRLPGLTYRAMKSEYLNIISKFEILNFERTVPFFPRVEKTFFENYD